MSVRCSAVWLSLGAVLAALGCDEVPVPSAVEAPPGPPSTHAGSAFDPTTAGRVSGRVTWQGALPDVPPFEARSHVPTGQQGRPRLLWANPNAPRIDPTGRGVAGSVVFLRGVAPEKARPWDHPPVRVEQRARRLHVVQGESDANIGFVLVGEAVEMVSRGPNYHALHADGAAFFTFMFPDPDRPRWRAFTSRGVVELSSAAGHFWMRAYLFVDEHPYYARTDAQGRFQLDRVPPGRYEVVCWLPSWRKERQERDPETSLVTRWAFRPAVERRRSVEVRAGMTTHEEFALSGADFLP
ncbi:MAG: hypothetical protein L0Z62_31455 [Gemmataceae bacterium]|nr:hypothetical protein [Gemmataceae bacterium]